MKIIQFEKKEITGISIRTTNSNEMSPETAKIRKLHQRFDNNIVVDYKSGARVYGVYFDYESDATGEFSVLSGTDGISSTHIEVEKLTLLSGKYLVFEGNGEMPQAVIDTWMEIWTYFSEENASNAEYQRAYTTDFEYYKNQNDFEIFISIK